MSWSYSTYDNNRQYMHIYSYLSLKVSNTFLKI